MNETNVNKQQFTLTTPLYYVNDVPHIGSAYTTMAADAIARFGRLQGQAVRLITGTDEHGQKIQRTAEERGIPPQEHCDRVAESFALLWQKLEIQYDAFIRTTDARHEAIVEAFFQRVWEQGDIYLARKQGWYCVSCEEFKEERELLEGNYCPIHTNKQAEWRDEENYFFRLSKYQKQLEQLYSDRPDFILPTSRRNEVLNFVKQGLQDFSISRVSVTWGLPVPTDPKHTIYVWFDALLGYVTALLDRDRESDLDAALSAGWPADIHLIGKDILRFHAVYWPAMLMSAGVAPPQRVFGHGFLTKDGQKMGKSTGNTIDPIALVDRYGSDAIRYYFLKEIELGKDGDFNEKRFITALNADLANDLGNLLNRTLKMAQKYCQGSVPKLDPAAIPDSDRLKQMASGLGDRVLAAYENVAIHTACAESLALMQASNKYLDDRAPWTLYKQGKQTEVEQVLYAVLEAVRVGAYLLSPVVPNLSNDIYRQLGFEIDFHNAAIANRVAPFPVHARWGALPGGQIFGDARPIFQRLEMPEDESS